MLRCHFARFATVSVAAALLAAGGRAALAQTPATGGVRSIPPPGIAVPDTDRADLTAGVKALGDEIARLQVDLKNKPALLRRLPDVEIYHNAVRYALTYNEFFRPSEIATARTLLVQGTARAKSLRDGAAPWTTQTGLVVLGYKSRIDGSVQPYGLVVPPTWVSGETRLHRLDFFCHGRGETLTELSFINEHQRSPGEFTPPDTFVLHPYGRFCCANRFAGEVDLFEALADAKTRYPIDDNRLVMRGFSMGGASAWQFATHHADKWVAASPGAGFSETVGFLNLRGEGKTPPPAYEETLFHWYDSTDYAVNLFQCPTVAYNGEDDGQKQAADQMETALKAEGLELTRVIGPHTGHRYHPDSKKDIDARLAAFAAKGRDPLPAHIRFTTWTLRYPSMDWVTVTGLAHHWQRARVNADLDADSVTVKTENVTRLTLAPAARRKTVTIDGQKLTGLAFVKTGDRWTSDKNPDGGGLRKRPGLQGPIDDAFMDSFVFVRPTGKPSSEATEAWVQSEMGRATRQWRAVFRGEAPVKDDRAVDDADIRDSNLVLWGDPSSNAVLARIAGRLPIRWNKDGSIEAGGATYAAGTHVLVFIYPNPLNPRHYVVINSGITFREAALLNNAMQHPMLPDWAIIDLTTPPDAYRPGRVEAAGFFDEAWKLPGGAGK